MYSPSVPAQQKKPGMPDALIGAPDLAQAGPPPSDVMAQAIAELQAQQSGAESPLTRQVQLQMLRGR